MVPADGEGVGDVQSLHGCRTDSLPIFPKGMPSFCKSGGQVVPQLPTAGQCNGTLSCPIGYHRPRSGYGDNNAPLYNTLTLTLTHTQTQLGASGGSQDQFIGADQRGSHRRRWLCSGIQRHLAGGKSGHQRTED